MTEVLGSGKTFLQVQNLEGICPGRELKLWKRARSFRHTTSQKDGHVKADATEYHQSARRYKTTADEVDMTLRYTHARP